MYDFQVDDRSPAQTTSTIMDAKQKKAGKTGRNPKSKLSLKKKNTSRQDDSDSSIGDQRSSSFDFLRAITGENSPNQSDDFREVKTTARLQGKKADSSKGLKRSLSLNKLKSKAKSSNRVRSSSLTPSGSESQNEPGEVNGVDKVGQSDQDSATDSSVTSCTVLLSKVQMVGETVAIPNKSAKDKQCSKPNKSSQSTDKNSSDVAVEGEIRKCPICLKVLGNIHGSQDLDQHISQCLKKRFSAVENTSEDEHLARQLQEREQEKEIEERQTEDEFYPCQFCHKDLSKMNSRRRLQHVNRCIDVSEKEVKEREAIEKQKAKMMIPDCPMCGLPLNTKLQRESHLKRCARELNVPSAQLIELVKRQEEELTSRVAEQSQSESEDSRRAADVPPAAVPKSKSRPKKRKKRPDEDVDEETQLAMAMSASLAPEQGTSGAAGEGRSDASDKKGKGKKKKNTEKEVPVLLVRSDTERQRMLENRLANLVAPQEIEDLEKTPSLRQSKVAGKRSKHSAPSKTSGKPASLLWELSAKNDPKQVSQTPFYVSQLKANIAVPEPGETPKRKRSRPQKHQMDDDQVGSTQTISSTLQVLMDLETEGAHASSSSSSPSLAESGRQRQRQASGFIDEKPGDSQARKSPKEHEKMVLHQLANLVNSKELSDVKIQTADKSVVYAHKFLLQLRCPKLLQDLNESAGKSTCSLDIPKTVLLSILKYVYCGSTEVDGDLALSVVQYAQKYNLPELAKACQPILKDCTTPHKTPKARRGRSSSKQQKDDDLQEVINSDLEKRISPVTFSSDEEDDGEFRNKDLHELMQSLWDDSDKESKSSSQDSTDGKGPNEEDMEEIYEYASTQAKQKKDIGQRSNEVTLWKTSVDLGTRVDMSTSGVDVPEKSTKSTAKKMSKESASAHCVQSDSESDNSSTKLPAVRGRLTRRGWKPISGKDLPQKQRKPGTDGTDECPSQRVSQSLDSSIRITDDCNEQDVEMEDISEKVEKGKAIGQDDTVNTSEKSGSKDVSKKLDEAPTKDAENVVDLTQESPPLSPVTRSSSSKKTSLRSSPTETVSQKGSKSPCKSTKSCNTEQEDSPRSAEDVAESVADGGNSKDQLDESIDESDTSWIIPSTPPSKPSRSKQNTFALPQKSVPHSKSSKSSRQSSSVVMASTPMDARNKGSCFIGSNFLPKMSPVKIVLEKMSLDASSPTMTVSRNADTANFEITKQGSPNAGSHKIVRSSVVATSSKQKKVAKTPNAKHEGRQNSKGTLSGQSTGSLSPDRRSTRSWSQSPSGRTRSSSQSQSPTRQNPKMMTPKDQTRKNMKSKKGVSPKQASPVTPKDYSMKSLRRAFSQSFSESKAVSTPNRRRTSLKDSGKTPDSLSNRIASPIVIPDAPDVPTPVVLSDESPSPTPSPTFGGNSSPTSPASDPTKGDANQRRPSQEYEEPTSGKPSKRKRKQSMPMRSPAKLLLTSNDRPVDTEVDLTPPTGNLKIKSKLKQKGRMPYSSPKIRRYSSSYHPLKKKYKSFSPIGREAIMRRRTRSFSKETQVPVLGNKSVVNGRSEIKGQSLNEKVCDETSPRKDVPSNDMSSSSPQKNDVSTQEKEALVFDVLNETEVPQSDNDGADGEDQDASIVRSALNGSIGNHTNGVSTNETEEEALFAYDVEDGGFDGCMGYHDISSHGNQDPIRGEQQNDSLSTANKVGPTFLDPSNKDGSDANRLTPSHDSPEDESYQQDSIQTGVRSPPEVRIAKTAQKEKFGSDLWAEHNISPSPKKQTINFSSPVISEKVQVLENFSPRLHHQSSQENEEVVSLTQSQVVPSHRQATASPTLRDHRFSPTQCVTLPVEETGYFGVADSFLQEEVIETSIVTEEVDVNGNHQEGDEAVFVPPGMLLK